MTAGDTMGFHEVTGHRAVIKVLQNSLRQGIVVHAYLFHGPEGVGKKFVAFSLAKAVNCLQEKGDFCGLCDSCRRIEAGNHPDFFFIEPEGQHLKIDQLRSLQASIQYKPYMAKRKVCIIDQADRMTTSAANSILKTLEEPPGDMIFILITANIRLIMPTIRSRCQLFQFSALPLGEVRRMIREKMGISKEEAYFLAAFSSGSFGLIYNQDLASLQQKREEVLRLIRDLHTFDIRRISTEAKALVDKKSHEDLQQLLFIWMYWYYDVWKYQITGGDRDLANADLISDIRRQSQNISSFHLEGSIRLIQKTSNLLQQNANKQLTMEVMLMQLSSNIKGCNNYEI
ncbi:MAG: DNA polymerase III subunit delta' [bacterium]